jgi:hypothetical protein
MKELKEKMLKACERQSLDKLYESQVDENLYNDDCDYDLDSRGLFFDLDTDEFYICYYVTPHSGWKHAHENQNPCFFVAWIDANTAIMNSLENVVNESINFDE